MLYTIRILCVCGLLFSLCLFGGAEVRAAGDTRPLRRQSIRRL